MEPLRGGVGLWAPVWPVWPRLLGGSLLSPPAIGVTQRYAQSQSPSGIVISGTEAPKEPSTAVLLQVSLAGSCERHPLAVFVENQDVDVASRRLSASCHRADEHHGRCRVQTGTKQCLQSRFGGGNARAGDGWQPWFRCVGVTRSHAKPRSAQGRSRANHASSRCGARWAERRRMACSAASSAPWRTSAATCVSMNRSRCAWLPPSRGA